MAIPAHYKDREYQSFEECPAGSGKSARRSYVCNDETSPIPVAITDGAVSGGVVTSTYDEALSVGAASETTVTTYTVPVGKKFKFDLVEASGDNISKFKVKIDSTIEAKKRSWWTSFNVDFDMKGLELAAGQVIELTAEHNNATMNSDYEARITGRLLDA